MERNPNESTALPFPVPHAPGTSPDVAEASTARTESRDAAVATAAADGDSAALGALFERFSPMVHSIMLVRVGPREAEDLTQDTFVRALRRIGTLQDARSVGAWLANIARNRAIDHLRWKQRWGWLVGRGGQRHEEGSFAPEPKPGSQGPSGDDVLRAIRSLPSAYHETLVLRLVAGLTGPQIALVLDMTDGSVRVNLSRGMAMLRERFERAATAQRGDA